LRIELALDAAVARITTERLAMRPKEGRDSGQNDLFQARLDQIVDLGHPLAKLALTIDWRFLEERFGAVYSDKLVNRRCRQG